MLRLEGITKNYYTATETVAALRGVSLSFRRNEFVSILGPSGCGKTTLLNIIGGLDRYTGGNLYIGGRPTCAFSEHDWDVYRNHRVGFIFQSYNLIPHQTILENVELALTIAGIGREERVARARRTLDRVGLAGMYGKRPNQLSGGQCQRVAIARALVNDPEILLADEPTGALDTVTSGQIMDLIREIAGERLVIMVTHNPELAEQYSTRIVRLLDGLVTEDTNPMTAEEEILECERTTETEAARDAAEEAALRAEGKGDREILRVTKKRREKAKMSLLTAFRLSARNLLSKRRRTALVGFAGSIGIIGIALVLALSAGIRGYVASMQDDMLSGNPITITKTTYDLAALTSMMTPQQKTELVKNPNRVYVNSLIEQLAKTAKDMESIQVNNDLSAEYVAHVLGMPEEYRAAVQVDYGIDLSHSIYTSRVLYGDGGVEHPSVTALTASFTSMIKKTSFGSYASYATTLGQLMAEVPDNADYVLSQYDVLSGKLAEGRDEVMLVVSADTELTDIVLAKLGYYTEAEFLNLLYDATGMTDESGNALYDEKLRKPEFTYEELMAKELTFYPNDSIYTEVTGSRGQMYTYANDEEQIKDKEGSLKLRVVGILRPKEEISFGCLTSGLYYTKALSDYAREVNYSSAIAEAIRGGDTGYLVGGLYEYQIPGMPTPTTVKAGVSFEYRYLDPATKAPATETGFVGGSILRVLDLSAMMNGSSGAASGTGGGTGSSSGGSATFSRDSVALTLADVGGADTPTSITIYPVSFENKDHVTEWLDLWNEVEDADGNDVSLTVTMADGTTKTIAGADRSHVTYTDTIALIINLINSMIDVVSTALIAFTSVSLVVSTVMIGILTYVSVVERIKEIGVIRSLGGRKKDVRHLFNAETFIIGFLAGLIGVLVTALLALLINLLIKVLAGVTVTAYLPLTDAIILVALSVGLTLISGLIPASAAARMDPVNALRSE